MTKILPDYSFERDGVPLSAWLWRLVDAERSVRTGAGVALRSMEWGFPCVHTDVMNMEVVPDIDAQCIRFAAAVKAVLSDPAFETQDFVEKLGAYLLAIEADYAASAKKWADESSRRGKRFDRLADHLMARVKAEGGLATEEGAPVTDAERRLMRLRSAYLCTANPKSSDFSQSERLKFEGQVAHSIFDALGAELLHAPEVLGAMLGRDRSLRDKALAAIARIGPAARGFAPALLLKLDEPAECGSWNNRMIYHALGVLARDDESLVDELIRRLGNEQRAGRCGVADVLREAGPALCGRESQVCALLRGMLDWRGEEYAAIYALASVGREMPAVRALVLDYAGPSRVAAATTTDTRESEMQLRGVALDSLRYLSAYPQECVPVLIEALASFEEYDPDREYRGAQSRIADALACFGPAAAAAAPALVPYLTDVSDDVPKAMVQAIAAMGPAAAVALPALYTLRESLWADGSAPDLTQVEVREEDDRVGWAIQRIIGLTTTQS